MKNFRYRFFLLLWQSLSLLPLRVHYFLSDVVLFPLLYYVLRYRRPLVDRQLADSFPERSPEERRAIARRFYRWLADYFVETIKAMTMSREEMMRRMQVEGMKQLEQQLQSEGKSFAFIYLGHYGNWEWVSSLPYWAQHTELFGQIYHPLHNRVADRLFLRMRARAGATNISMRQTLRVLLKWQREGKQAMVGFISDQAPQWASTHHWQDFLHHPTAFFLGAEQLGGKLGACYYYAHITRPRRGYYHCTLRPLEIPKSSTSPFPVTDAYAQALQEDIRHCPHLWFWTHNRWKRTREAWEKLQQEQANKN